MTDATKQTLVALWHYHCADCGFGDAEAGYLAATHAIYCEVCLEDERYVPLRRWPAEPESGALTGARPRRR